METNDSSVRNEISAETPIPCRDLRNKEMYYQGEEEDEFASGIYWCQRTRESFGPDGQPCAKKECCEGRSCYRNA